jgi:outer membrane protein assembly factor BamB
LFAAALGMAACGNDEARTDAGADADAVDDVLPPVDVELDTSGEDTADIDAGPELDATPDVPDPWAEPGCLPVAPQSDPVFPPSLETTWEVARERTTFASAVTWDVNRDCVRDVILGAGTEGPAAGYIEVLDGKTGDALWRTDTIGEVYSRAQFYSRTGEAIDTVVSAGRGGMFSAHDLATGTEIWAFDLTSPPVEGRWNNFNTPQVVPDADGDGVSDLATTSGAISRDAGPFEEREVNWLLLVSGATGELLRATPMPDGRECYMAPTVWEREEPWLVWGSGGETFSGSLWGVPLADYLDLSTEFTASSLATSGTTRGFMSPPSQADLTGDGALDLIVAAFEGRVFALDNRTGAELWSWSVEGHETYASAALGLFDADEVVDAAILLNAGAWADGYTGTLMVILSGATGEELFRETGAGQLVPSPVMADLNEDGRQEVLFLDATFEQTAIRMVTFGATESVLLGEQAGASFSTPWIDDLNLDGQFELVVVTADLSSGLGTNTVSLRGLGANRATGGWYGYLNRNGRGVVEP